MTKHNKSPLETLVESLDMELIARGERDWGNQLFEFGDNIGTPERDLLMKQEKKLYDAISPKGINQAFKHISTEKLVRMLIVKARELNEERGIWGEDDRKDVYELHDERIKKNTDSITAICSQDCLSQNQGDFTDLKTTCFSKTFNLCDSEPFYHQPIAAGRLFTGFLLSEDIVATAGHCADKIDVKKLRIVFGFRMHDSSTPVTQIPRENIYEGRKIIRRVINRNTGSDWALIQLEKKVTGHTVASLARKNLFCNQQVYIMGHPLGLPLKYSAGAQVRNISGTCFSADLNVYSGNSGSPVFCADTHDVVGIVVRGDSQDFRWTGKGWRSIIYPNRSFQSCEPQCTRTTEFIEFLS